MGTLQRRVNISHTYNGKEEDEEERSRRLRWHNHDEKPNELVLSDLLFRTFVISLILVMTIVNIFYMRCTISNYASFMNRTQEALFIIDPDSRLLNIVIPVAAYQNITNNSPSPSTTPTLSVPDCTPPLPTPTQTPVIGIEHPPLSLYFGYECGLDAVDVPEQCTNSGFYMDYTNNIVKMCTGLSTQSFVAPCLMGIFESIGVNGNLFRTFALLSNDSVSPVISDTGPRFISPSTSDPYTTDSAKHMCPARSLPFASGVDEFATQSPPFLLRLPVGIGKTQFGTCLAYSTSQFAQVHPESLGILGSTITPAGIHMSSVPYVSEMAGISLGNVKKGDIYEVTFLLDMGNLAYRPDVFFDSNDAYTDAFRLTEASYSIYARCFPVSDVDNYDEILSCATAPIVHVEYGMSKSSDDGFNDATSFKTFNPGEESSRVSDGYYNQFVNQKKVRTRFTVVDAPFSLQNVECHPVFVWDIPDLHIPVPPSIDDVRSFRCGQEVNAFTNFVNDNVYVDASPSNNNCKFYNNNNKFCGESTTPGLNHCNRRINNAGLVTTNSQSTVKLLYAQVSHNYTVERVPGRDYSVIHDEYASDMAQSWCGITPLSSFSTPGSATNADGEPYNCCTGYDNRAYTSRIGIDFCNHSPDFCPSISSQPNYHC